MKKLISLIAALCIFNSITIYGQNLIGQSRRTISPTALQEYSQITRALKAGLPNNGYKNVPVSSKFTITDQTANEYIIYFWNWAASNANYANLNFDATANEVRYFLIPKSLIDNISEKIYNKFSPSVGALSFPFRYRPQDGKFEKSFSLSLAGGVKWNPWGTNEHTFSALVGVGASSVTLNKYNTDPASNITQSSDRAAVTISLSLLYEWQHLQIGISSGIDNLFDNEVEKWKYQSKPWFTIGVGISIFSKSEISHAGGN